MAASQSVKPEESKVNGGSNLDMFLKSFESRTKKTLKEFQHDENNFTKDDEEESKTKPKETLTVLKRPKLIKKPQKEKVNPQKVD